MHNWRPFGKNGRLIIQHYRGRKGQRHPIFQDPPPATVSPVARASGVQAKIVKEKLDFQRVTRAKPKRTFPSDKSLVTPTILKTENRSLLKNSYFDRKQKMNGIFLVPDLKHKWKVRQ